MKIVYALAAAAARIAAWAIARGADADHLDWPREDWRHP